MFETSDGKYVFRIMDVVIVNKYWSVESDPSMGDVHKYAITMITGNVLIISEDDGDELLRMMRDE